MKPIICSFCGRDCSRDEGHFEAVDEDKIMCIQCYKKIVVNHKEIENMKEGENAEEHQATAES